MKMLNTAILERLISKNKLGFENPNGRVHHSQLRSSMRITELEYGMSLLITICFSLIRDWMLKFQRSWVIAFFLKKDTLIEWILSLSLERIRSLYLKHFNTSLSYKWCTCISEHGARSCVYYKKNAIKIRFCIWFMFCPLEFILSRTMDTSFLWRFQSLPSTVNKSSQDVEEDIIERTTLGEIWELGFQNILYIFWISCYYF